MHLGLKGRVKGEEAGGPKSIEENACDWLLNIFYPKLVLRTDKIVKNQMNKDFSKGKVKHDQQQYPWLMTMRRFDWIQISGTQQKMTREWQYFHYTSNTYGCVQGGVRDDTHFPWILQACCARKCLCYGHFIAFKSHKYKKQYLANMKLISKALLFGMEQPQPVGISVLSSLFSASIPWFHFKEEKTKTKQKRNLLMILKSWVTSFSWICQSNPAKEMPTPTQLQTPH